MDHGTRGPWMTAVHTLSGDSVVWEKPVQAHDEGAWRLRARGEVYAAVHQARPRDDVLRVTLEAAGDGVQVTARDDGVTAFRSVVATVPLAVFEAFARAIAAALDGPGGNCGTHGFWVMRAGVQLPLMHRELAGEARETAGFSSEPVAHALVDLVEAAGELPGARVETWRTVHRRRWLATRGLPLALVVLAGALGWWLR